MKRSSVNAHTAYFSATFASPTFLLWLLSVLLFLFATSSVFGNGLINDNVLGRNRKEKLKERQFMNLVNPIVAQDNDENEYTIMSSSSRLRSASIATSIDDNNRDEGSVVYSSTHTTGDSLEIQPSVPASLLRPDEIEEIAKYEKEQQELEEEQERFRRENEARRLSGKTPTITPTVAPTIAPTKPPNSDLNPPDCIRDESELVYVNGQLSFEGTFANCLKNIADPSLLPTLINGSASNVMFIDALAGTAELDFYLRLFWRDNRFNMPLFWNKTSKNIRKDGFYLTTYIVNNPGVIWTPDLRFHDIANMEVLAQTFRFNSSNIFFWSRHILAEFMQPKFTFALYPKDNQTIHIRYGSYALNEDYFNLYVYDSPGDGFPAISYNIYYDKSITFLSNPVWKHNPSWNTYMVYLSSSRFQNVVFHIPVARDSRGVVTRLVVPIAILTVLGGVIFWSNPEDRVNFTITLLLSVSALYVVILNNIPLVGYLTAIDQYCIMMFAILALATIFHQIYYVLMQKTQLGEHFSHHHRDRVFNHQMDEVIEHERRKSHAHEHKVEIHEKLVQNENGADVNAETRKAVDREQDNVEEFSEGGTEVPNTESRPTEAIESNQRKGSRVESTVVTVKKPVDDDNFDDDLSEHITEKWRLAAVIVQKLSEAIGRIVIIPLAVLALMIVTNNVNETISAGVFGAMIPIVLGIIYQESSKIIEYIDDYRKHRIKTKEKEKEISRRQSIRATTIAGSLPAVSGGNNKKVAPFPVAGWFNR